MTCTGRAGTCVRWLLVIAAVAGCAMAGRGRLAAPPLGHPAEWQRWWSQRGALVATFALARLAVLAGAGYLLLLAVVATVARAWRPPRLVALLEWAAPEALRRMAMAMAGLASSAALAAATTAGAPAAAGAPTVTGVVAGARLPSGAAPVLRRVPTPPPLLERVDPPPPAPPPPPGDAGVWIVGPGDSLWSIAEATVRARQPARDGRAVAGYWLRVVEVNRPRLPVPGDPNLIFPGDRVVLPPLPAG